MNAGATVRRASLCVVLALGCLVACSEQRSATTPSSVVQTLTVTGVRPLLEGETVTLTATAVFSTGATETVTDRVTWSSDDPRIATVSDRGVVAALAAGDTRITATLNGVKGTVTVSVGAQKRFALTLRVHESAPTEDVNIARVAVTAVDSGGTTASGETDAAGGLVLTLKAGPARITLAAAGYEPSEVAVDVTADKVVELPLVPVLQEVRQSFEAVLDKTLRPPFLDQRRFRVNVHHSGVLFVRYTQSALDPFAQAHTCIDIRDATNRSVARTQGVYDNWAPDIRLPVDAGQTYKVIFFSCNPSGLPPTYSLVYWGGEVRHPS